MLRTPPIWVTIELLLCVDPFLLDIYPPPPVEPSFHYVPYISDFVLSPDEPSRRRGGALPSEVQVSGHLNLSRTKCSGFQASWKHPGRQKLHVVRHSIEFTSIRRKLLFPPPT